MIEQKNRMDPATTMHHLLEFTVDFELLWRAYPKFGEGLKGSALEFRGGILNLE